MLARCMTPWLSLCQWPSVRKCCPTGFFQKISYMTSFFIRREEYKATCSGGPKKIFYSSDISRLAWGCLLTDCQKALPNRLFVSCFPPNWQFLTLFVSKFFAALQQYSPTLLSLCRTMCVLYVLQHCDTSLM